MGRFRMVTRERDGRRDRIEGKIFKDRLGCAQSAKLLMLARLGILGH